MKRVIFSLLFVGMALLSPFGLNAHELIPKALREYVSANPNVTAVEIKAFVDAQAPEFADKFKNGEEILAVVQNQDTTLLDNAWDFLQLGVEHILSGADHILFVLSLLLVLAGLREIFKLTAFFTVAHSITLILAGTGALVVNPNITEPIIAFSIAYVAISSVFLTNNKYLGGTYSKPVSVFFFGLFHGLGFAGLLREIQIPVDKYVSSLFSFNVGIEIGQLIIVALAFPFIYYFRNKSWYPLFIKILAVIIAAIAIFWMIERIFFGG